MTAEEELREKAVNLFTFLQEFVKLRSRSVRDLAAYDHVDWLADILEEAESGTSVLSAPPTETSWVSVDRLDREASPAPPPELQGWMADPDGREPPELYEVRGLSDAEERFDDDPGRVAAWHRFLDLWRQWAEEDERREKVERVYRRLFEIERLLEREGERRELLLAVGLLTWRRPYGLVRRHLLVTEARIDLDPESGRLTVGPASDAVATAFEKDMLDVGDQPRPTSLDQMVDAARAITNALDPEEVRPLLERCATELAPDGTYHEDMRAVAQPADAPRIDFAPALIVRTRGEHSLIHAYGSIIKDLNHAGVSPAMRGLIEPVDNEAEAERNSTSDHLSAGNGEDHYLPLPANDQQREIVRRLQRRRGVVVQGPPGTGKSHTIANLIADLLARGERILVTSQTARALEVLKDKLPPEIAELCVSVLGDSRDAQTRLDASVQGIMRKRAEYDEKASQQEIADLAKERASLLERRVELHREVTTMREAEARHVDLGGDYQGRPHHVAERLAREEERFAWLQEADGPASPLTNEEACELLALLRKVGEDERNRVAKARLPLAQMLPPAQFEELVERERRVRADVEREAERDTAMLSELEDQAKQLGDQAERARAALPEGPHPPSERVVLIGRLLHDIVTRLRRLESVDYDWVSTATDDALHGRLAPWLQRAERAEGVLAEVRDAVEETAGRRLDGAAGRALPPLLEQARSLRDHFVSGKKLKGVFRTPRSVRQAAELLDHVRLDGSPPDDLTTVELTIASLRAADGAARAWFAWRGEPAPATEYPAADVARLREELDEFSELKDLEKSARQLGDTLSQIAGFATLGFITADERTALRAWLDQAEETTRLVAEAERCARNREEALAAVDAARHDAERQDANRSRRLAEAQKPRRRLLRALHEVGGLRDPIVDELTQAVRECDATRYRQLYHDLEAIEQCASDISRLDALIRRLNEGGGESVVRAIQDDPTDPAWDERLADLEPAWAWRAADAELARRTDPSRRRKVEGELARVEQRLRRVVTDLAAARAWSKAFQRMTTREQQHLEAYVSALRRLGKGTGKYAATRRREAQTHLDKCQESIPAWIMPFYRVAQHITPRRDRFDVVIVDEASQAGMDALLLFHLAPKIVVVGDDQQIAPENVGVNRGDVEELQRRYLSGFELRDVFNAETSLFEQARIRFPDLIVLREHFRCMPEIIGFSNDLCYRERGAPLVPLRQFGADRLPPLRSLFTSNGYREGDGSSTRNRVEAEALVNDLCRCLGDPAYRGKTFGVIGLLGHGQSKLIEQLIRERVDPKTILERQIRVGDPYAFQGDERDVIFLSLVATKEPGRRLNALTREQDKRRFNVAVSRAKDQVVLVHSIKPGDLSPQCVRHKLLTHVLGPRPAQLLRGPDPNELGDEELMEPFESVFEQRVYQRIAGRGYHVIPQYKVGGYRIDLVVVGEAGMLAVECDGDAYHTAENFEHDLARQRELERCGWTFFRIRGSAFFRDPEGALEALWPLLASRGIEPSPLGARCNRQPANGGPQSPSVTVTGGGASNHAERATQLNSKTTPSQAQGSTAVAVTPKGQQRLGAQAVPSASRFQPTSSIGDTSTSVGGRPTHGRAPRRPKAEEPRDATMLQGGPPKATSRRNDGARGLRPYNQFDAGDVASRRPFPNPLEAASELVTQGIEEIVKVEGPIKVSRLYSLYAQASGRRRVTRVLRQALERRLKHLARSRRLIIDYEGDTPRYAEAVVRLPGTPAVVPRERGPRQLQDIPRREIAHLIGQLRSVQPDLSGDALRRRLLAELDRVRLTAAAVAYLDSTFHLLEAADREG